MSGLSRLQRGYKLDFLTGVDPDTGLETSLYNPRNQLWNEHFQWSPDGVQVIGLTAIRRATIKRLKMNRNEIVAARRLWVQAGWHPPQSDHFPFAD